MRIQLALAACAAAVLLAAPAFGDESLVRATLSNGLRVVIVVDPIAPVATVEMAYLVGAVDTPPGFPGMAHAQEHEAFRGLDGLSAEQLADMLTSLGGRASAFTEPTVTTYHLTVPAPDLDIALRIEASRLRGVDDAQSEWERERGAIEQEVAMDESSGSYQTFSGLIAAAYSGTPYAIDGLGTKESFDKTTSSMLRAFYDRWYGPNNAVLVVAGDVDPAAALSTIRALMEDIPRKPIPKHSAVILHAIVNHDVKTNAPGFDAMGFRMPGTDSPDFAAGQLVMDMLNDPRSAIGSLAARGRAAAAGSETPQTLPASSLGVVYAELPNFQGAGVAPDLVGGIVNDYASVGFPAALVAAAKKSEALRTAALPDSIESLADAWTNAIAVEGRTSPYDDADAIARVTVADVNRVARIYLDPTKALQFVPSPVSQPRALRVSRVPESFSPRAAKPVALPDWAASLTQPDAAAESAAMPASRTLPNGLKVLVLTEPAGTTITIRGRIKIQPSMEEPQGQEGVAALTAAMFAFGTSASSYDAFQARVESIGGDERAGPSFGVHVMAQDFDSALQLLSQHELNPALDARAFTQVQSRLELAALFTSFGVDVDRTIAERILPPTDPSLREMTAGSVTALTVSDVKAFLKKAYRPDVTTIVIAGNVSPDDAYAEVEKWFGSWSADPPPPPTDLPAVPVNQADTAWLRDPLNRQDDVTMTESLGIVRSDLQYYALALGNEIEGGGAFATRLFTDLRENRGLVYAVGSHLDVGDTRATYTITFACDPSNVKEAEAIVRHDIATLRTAPPSADELARAKMEFLDQLVLDDSSEERIANRLLDQSESSLPVDEAQRSARIVSGLTGADVQAAFQQWIRPDDFVSVVSGPKPQ